MTTAVYNGNVLVYLVQSISMASSNNPADSENKCLVKNWTDCLAESK
jgi:hypothetical protein